MKVKKKILKFSVSLLLVIIMLISSVSTTISILPVRTYKNKAPGIAEDTDNVLLTVDKSDWRFEKKRS